MAKSLERLCSVIESLLLVSSEPLPFERLLEVLQGEDSRLLPEDLRAAIDRLIKGYANPERNLAVGFRVEEVAGGLQLRTTPENAPYVRRFLAARPQRLTRPALETLAIVAYRQPATKPEIETIRGVDCGAVLKALLDRDLIKILGKAEEVGRPILYGTTPKFLELFGLKSLTALPTLREYHELDREHQQQVDELYEAERPSIAELAGAAQFLMDRQHDPDLDELDRAVLAAEAADLAAASVLNPPKPPEPEAAAEAPASGTEQ